MDEPWPGLSIAAIWGIVAAGEAAWLDGLMAGHLLAAALMMGMMAQPPNDPEAGLDAIVVTGQRPNRVALDEPIAFFRRHCFDANRLTDRSLAPADGDRHWRPLEPETRAQLGIADPATILMALTDHVRGHTLVLRIERLSPPPDLTESRCTLTVIGGGSHDRLHSEMAALFRGPGTQRHIGHRAGAERVPGWRQHAWTGMPQRGSRGWRALTGGSPRPGGSFIVVTDNAFYDAYSFLAGELKTRVDRRPRVSILSLRHTFRDGRRSRR